MKDIRVCASAVMTQDGSRGGWGAVLEYNGRTRVIEGFAPGYRDALILGALAGAVGQVKEPCRITILTDSAYVSSAYRDFYATWKAASWKKPSGTPIAYGRQWAEFDRVCSGHQIELVMCGPGSAVPLLNQARNLAQGQAESATPAQATPST